MLNAHTCAHTPYTHVDADAKKMYLNRKTRENFGEWQNTTQFLLLYFACNIYIYISHESKISGSKNDNSCEG